VEVEEEADTTHPALVALVVDCMDEPVRGEMPAPAANQAPKHKAANTHTKQEVASVNVMVQNCRVALALAAKSLATVVLGAAERWVA
jgi:hypothetical protein